MPNGRCRMHGGKSLIGIASPTLRTGRYSRNLPTRLSGRYQEAAQDSELLSLREDIALIDARLEDVLAKVDTGECGETWRALQDAVHEFDVAERKGNFTTNEKKQAEYAADREEAMRTIIVLVQAGMSDYAAWSEVKDLLERRRKIAESETRRLVAMQQMITNDQALTLTAALIASIRAHVTDRNALAAISADIVRLTPVPDRDRAASGLAA